MSMPGMLNEGVLILPSEGVTNYELPTSEQFEEEMQLGTIPSPFRNTVRYIHAGISPRFSNGFVILSSTGTDIHHIVKRSYVKSDRRVARELLPFNGAVKATYDMLTDPKQEVVNRYGGMGNMLINLIPLDYSFHHRFIEERPYNHEVRIRLDGDEYAVTLPELLMSFNIFNLRFRLNPLVDYIYKGKAKCQRDIDGGEETKVVLAQRHNINAWNQMEIELPRIEVVAEEIQEDHPHLYRIWESAVGLRSKYLPRIPVVEH